MKHQKRIAAIHDISGFGKCSLTVVLPIISAAGVEVAVVPTAVLSTHTGGISGYTYRDLTNDLRPFMEHWFSLNISFDAVYSGFLGSFEQLDIVSSAFDKFKKNGSLIMVDPVMADNGELYKLFTPDFVSGMRCLCKKADLIVPNITEALLLLDETYCPGPYTPEYIEYIVKKLGQLGPSQVVLTGVWFKDEELGVATYNRNTDTISYVFAPKIPGYFHGTGDVFGSALLAAVLNGFDLMESAEIAVRFTTNSIKRTVQAKTDVRFGVDFEQNIPGFLKDLHII